MDRLHAFVSCTSRLMAFGCLLWVSTSIAATGALDTVRFDFISSPEFGARVNVVINAGCMP
jgi:hypothetical protein